MSQPLIYQDPNDGQLYRVEKAELITLESIDEQIAHHQNRINELNVERQKVQEITASDNQAAETPAAAEQPATSTDVPSAPADAPAAPAATDPATQTQAPVDQSVNAPEQPAQTPPIAA